MKIHPFSERPRKTSVRDERVKGSTAGAHHTIIYARKKSNSRISPYCVPNEYICAELGRYLRLPIAPGAIIPDESDNSKYWYASLDFSSDGEPLPEAIPEECWRLLPELCAGIVLFDILIANGDRHTKNLFLDKSGEVPMLRLFDHEAALLGGEAGQAEGHLTGSLRNEAGIPGHCLTKLVTEDRLKESRWFERICSIPDGILDEICLEAAEYGMSDAETKVVIAFLKKRRDDLPRLIRAERSRKRTL